ncbi:hypothetical protein BN2497_12035 [Janthinobacterium sp. CG23_2]|nr:hypothetical protein BN2497_12035 [Janthinobacterium sp. CG23_2]CUU32415.1 hypothetical protein BN3177_12035 [Janthinobacterium sp. CG23_2]
MRCPDANEEASVASGFGSVQVIDASTRNQNVTSYNLFIV